MNPRNADHRDLQLATDGDDCVVITFAETAYLVVRKMAPLA